MGKVRDPEVKPLDEQPVMVIRRAEFTESLDYELEGSVCVPIEPLRFRALLIRAMISIREERGLSKLEMANRLGITHSTLVRFEQSGNPQAETIDRYLEAMGSNLDELLDQLIRERALY